MSARARRSIRGMLSLRGWALAVIAFAACRQSGGARSADGDSGSTGLAAAVEAGAEPADSSEPLTAVAVSIGVSAACALTASGSVLCWGCNQNGVLANDSLVSSAVPVPIAGLTGHPTSVAVGANSACAVTTGGEVECWGDMAAASDGGSSALVVAVSGFAGGVTAVSVGDGTACGLTTSGQVACWGVQLGGHAAIATPSAVAGLPGRVTSVSVGFDSACAVTAQGAVFCWGANDFGQLGNGSTEASTTPVPVTGLASGVTAVSVGQQSACAIAAGGQVECWGAIMQGVVSPTASVPVPVAGLTSGVTSVSIGTQSACAVRAGSVESWGHDTQDGIVPTYPPAVVPGLGGGAVSVSVGAAAACAIAAGGSVVCWGAAQCGSLGNIAYTSVPIAVPR